MGLLRLLRESVANSEEGLDDLGPASDLFGLWPVCISFPIICMASRQIDWVTMLDSV